MYLIFGKTNIDDMQINGWIYRNSTEIKVMCEKCQSMGETHKYLSAIMAQIVKKNPI